MGKSRARRKLYYENPERRIKKISFVEDINGIGMEIGVRLTNGLKDFNMMKFIEKARSQGLHLANADSFSFQIMPPLTTGRNILDSGLEIFIKTIKSFK